MAEVIPDDPRSHTPAPWYVVTKSLNPHWRGDGTEVCSAHGRIADANQFQHRMVDEAQANARLIAAAPDLLEALKGLQKKFWDVAERHNDRSCDYDVCPEVRAVVAAIKKAEGRS